MSIRLNGSTSGYTEIDAPAVAGSNTLVLPTGNGSSGQVLSTNGSGALSWIGAGKILQVVQTTKTDTFSTTSFYPTFADVTGLSVSITPSSASNKILVMASFQVQSSNAGAGVGVQLLRGSTAIFKGDSASSRATVSAEFRSSVVYSASSSSIIYLDSPASTSSTTYKIQLAILTNTYTAYINRTGDDGDDVNRGRTPASITVMEVAA